MSTKIALITGSSRGIGLGLVKEYAQNGYKVLATARNPDKATELQSFLKEHNQPPALTMDISSMASIQACCQELTKENQGVIDILINNAGISNQDHPDDPASTCNPEEFDFVQHTNVTGVLMTTQAFLPMLEKSNDPKVVNISSGLGSCTASPRFSTTAYQCSKAALNMLTKCFADEVRRVTFVAIHPGWVQTDMGNSKNRQAPVTIQASAAGIFRVAKKISGEKSGGFYNFEGDSIPY